MKECVKRRGGKEGRAAKGRKDDRYRGRGEGRDDTGIRRKWVVEI